ncbi:uncharacterized protein [Diadema setosum]|uniref:uncharacterized protein n=1 Tax=Diadema setosum TaxID=31175 RepID=UPI003B3AB68D
MATDATAACSSTSSELKCFIHSESASDDDLKAFNATTWAKVLTSAAIWKYSDGKKAKIATDFLAMINTTSDSVEIPQQAGFHRKCYQQFTDKTKVDQAKRKQEKAELEDEEMYNIAIYLKKEIEDIPTQTMQWPPDSTHLTLGTAEKIVPTKLYNFLSWMVGFNEDPEGDKFVTLPEEQHRRILSLSQDIIYLTSKGRKAMPKQTSLAMAVRHITGSAQLIGLLNGFGHATSHTKVLEHNTALAKKEIQNGENKVHTTLVWDNNDFGEETLLGRGTTHNTNGIAIQHKPAPIDQPPETSVSVKKTKERTLKASEEVLVPFFGTKKANPQPLGPELKLQKEEPEYSEPIQAARRIDNRYFITKYPVPDSSRLLPGWTGYNQMLVNSIPPKATVAYLPVIDASPTQMNAVNTLLHRSIDIADSLKLDSVVVVVDQAIYAKVQSVRWQTPIFQK